MRKFYIELSKLFRKNQCFSNSYTFLFWLHRPPFLTSSTVADIVYILSSILIPQVGLQCILFRDILSCQRHRQKPLLPWETEIMQTSLQKPTGLKSRRWQETGFDLNLGTVWFQVPSLCTTSVHYMDQRVPPFFNKSPTLQGILRFKSGVCEKGLERGAWATGLPLLCFLSLSSQIHSIQL